MYNCNLVDLDGHVYEMMWMDMSTAQPNSEFYSESPSYFRVLQLSESANKEHSDSDARLWYIIPYHQHKAIVDRVLGFVKQLPGSQRFDGSQFARPGSTDPTLFARDGGCLY